MTNNSGVDNKSTISRTIFLNIFISLFIIICYYLVSSVLGSISSPFLTSDDFSIQFSLTLFIFSFFVILAGPFHGFFTGFLSEFIFQIAYYRTIYFDWCLIVGILGLISGVYKYRIGLKIYYPAMSIFVSSIISAILIYCFETLRSSVITEPSIIFINYSLKFLTISIITIQFWIPLLLLLYDKFFASKERELYYFSLTHHPISGKDHTFYFQFGKTKVYFCSRCSGLVIGGVTAIFTTTIIELAFNYEFNPELALLLLFLFPIPAEIDWGTQKLMRRKSSTGSRIFTGILLGSGLHFVKLSQQYFLIGIGFVVFYFGIVFLINHIVHKREAKIEEIHKDPSD